jgi:hypothetical protein
VAEDQGVARRERWLDLRSVQLPLVLVRCQEHDDVCLFRRLAWREDAETLSLVL